MSCKFSQLYDNVCGFDGEPLPKVTFPDANTAAVEYYDGSGNVLEWDGKQWRYLGEHNSYVSAIDMACGYDRY